MCEHPVIVEQIEHFQAQYPDHYSDEVADNVIAGYGEIAVAKIAHSEHLKGMHLTSTIETSSAAAQHCTMSLLGLSARRRSSLRVSAGSSQAPQLALLSVRVVALA